LEAHNNETLIVISESIGIPFTALVLIDLQFVGGRRRLTTDDSGTLVLIFELDAGSVTLSIDELTENLWNSSVLTGLQNDLSILLGVTLQSFVTLSMIVQTSSPTLFPTLSLNDTGLLIFDDVTTSADSMKFFLGSFGLLVPLVIFLLPYSNSKGILAQPFPWSHDAVIAEAAYDVLKFKALQKKSVFERWLTLTVLEIQNRHPLFTCKVAPFANFSYTQRGIVTAAAFSIISATQAYFYTSDPLFMSGGFQFTSALFASVVALVLIQLFVNSKPGRMHHKFGRKKCKCNHRSDYAPQSIEGAMVEKMVDIYEDVRSNPGMEPSTAPITAKIRNFILDNGSNPMDDDFGEKDTPREILKRALNSSQGWITDEEFQKLVIIQNWVMKQTYSFPSFAIRYTWFFACIITYGCIFLTITYAIEFDKNEDVHEMVFSQWATGSIISFGIFLFLLPILLAPATGFYIFCGKKRNEKDTAYLEIILSSLINTPKKLANVDIDVVIGWLYKRSSEVMMVPVDSGSITRDRSVSPEVLFDIEDGRHPSRPDYKEAEELERDEGVLSPSCEERFEFGVTPGNSIENRRINRVGEESPKPDQRFEFENTGSGDGAEPSGMWISNESSSHLVVVEKENDRRRLSKSVKIIDENSTDWQESSLAPGNSSVVLPPLEVTSMCAEPSEGAYEDTSPHKLDESIKELPKLTPEQRDAEWETDCQNLSPLKVYGQPNLSDTAPKPESKEQYPIEREEELHKSFGSCESKNQSVGKVTNISKQTAVEDQPVKPGTKEKMPDREVKPKKVQTPYIRHTE